MMKQGIFVYRFMAGVADFATGGVTDNNFDPHEHRKVPNPTTYAETMIHLLKACLGAGMLAMPNSFNRVGLVFGLFGLIIIAVFANYCLQLLILGQYEQCKRHKVGYMQYQQSMLLALKTGPPSLRIFAAPLAFSVDFMLILWQVGICAIYFVFAAENFQQVLGFYGHHYKVRCIIVCLLFPQIIINLIRDLKFLIPFSAISNLLLFSGVQLVFWYLLEEDIEPESHLYEMKSITEIPIFIGITLFALEAVGVVLALEYNMDKPRQFVGMFGLLSTGMAIITTVFGLVGFFGCLKYGDEAKGSITLNLPEKDKKAQASKMLLAMALYLSIPLQNFVAYQITWRKLSKSEAYNTKCVDYTARIMLIIIPFTMAIVAPTLSGFIGLLGALCLSMVGVMFPAIIDLCIWYPDKYGPCNYKLLRDIAIFIIGLFCCVSGCYTSLLVIIADLYGEETNSTAITEAVTTTLKPAEAAAEVI